MADWNFDRHVDPVFDIHASDTHSFELTLTPETFNGPALTVAMQVNVSNP